MDASVQRESSKAFVPWRPEVGPNGSVQIGVERWDDGPYQRYTLDSVSPEEYLKLWNDGWLKFQGKFSGKPFDKPEHYPTSEQVEEYLGWRAREAEKKAHELELAEKARPVPQPVEEKEEDEPPRRPAPRVQVRAVAPASKSPERQPEPSKQCTFRPAVDPVVFRQYRMAAQALKTREGVVTREALAEVLFLPRKTLDTFLDSHPEFEAELGLSIKIKEGSEKTKAVPITPEFDIDACVETVSSLTHREKSIVEDVVKGRNPRYLTPESLKVRISNISTKLGIPMVGRSKSFDRRELLRQVWAQYKKPV